MKCNDMQQQLVSLVYGELDPEEEKSVQAHLESCSSCLEIYQEMKGTSDLLEKWEVETPKMNFLFVSESTSPWKAWKEKLIRLSWGRRLAWGIPAFATVCFLILALLNFQADYQEGQWHVSFSLFPKNQNPQVNQQAVLTEALQQNQKETLLLIAKMIEDSEYRQRSEYTLTLSKFAQEMERQRLQDLNTLGQSFAGFQQSTEGRFHQYNNVINDLIQMASYKVEKK